jgi:hypothetical protein
LLCSCHWTWLCIQFLRTCWWCSHSFTITYFQRSQWIFFMIMYLHKIILIAKSITKAHNRGCYRNQSWMTILRDSVLLSTKLMTTEGVIRLLSLIL